MIKSDIRLHQVKKYYFRLMRLAIGPPSKQTIPTATIGVDFIQDSIKKLIETKNKGIGCINQKTDFELHRSQ